MKADALYKLVNKTIERHRVALTGNHGARYYNDDTVRVICIDVVEAVREEAAAEKQCPSPSEYVDDGNERGRVMVPCDEEQHDENKRMEAYMQQLVEPLYVRLAVVDELEKRTAVQRTQIQTLTNRVGALEAGKAAQR